MANKFYATSACLPDLNAALDRVVDQVATHMPSPDLVFMFFSGYEPDSIDRAGPQLRSRLGATTLLGCNCVGVVSNRQEIENDPAISIWAAELRDTEILPMHLQFERSQDGGAIVGWPEATDGPWPEDSSFILLGEPFGFPVDALLERLNEDRPGVKVAGGMASGAAAPGEARLLLNDEVHRDGAVVIRMSGGTRIQTMVSQGCRPIGETLVVTRSERNVIFELGGEPALIQLKKIFDQLPTREQRMVQNGLHVGRVISEYQDKFKYGDFLIRNVVGIEKETGAMTVGDYIRPGQTIRFHIRDQETASQDLKEMLDTVEFDSCGGGLLFTCNGRGLNLFPEPNHDAEMISDRIDTNGTGEFPLAGFFAAGEIGPVSGKNFLHGFTASLVIFG